MYVSAPRRGGGRSGRIPNLEAVWSDHARIFERIERRDAAGAAAAMGEHIARSGSLLLA